MYVYIVHEYLHIEYKGNQAIRFLHRPVCLGESRPHDYIVILAAQVVMHSAIDKRSLLISSHPCFSGH